MCDGVYRKDRPDFTASRATKTNGLLKTQTSKQYYHLPTPQQQDDDFVHPRQLDPANNK